MILDAVPDNGQAQACSASTELLLTVERLKNVIDVTGRNSRSGVSDTDQGAVIFRLGSLQKCSRDPYLTSSSDGFGSIGHKVHEALVNVYR